MIYIRIILCTKLLHLNIYLTHIPHINHKIT